MLRCAVAVLHTGLLEHTACQPHAPPALVPPFPLHAEPPKMLGPEAPPEEAAAHNPPVAALYLAYIGLLTVIAVAGHAVVVLAWKSFSFTVSRPMPEVLFFPVPELLLLDVLVMPVAVNSMMLVVQSSRVELRLLGVATLALLLAYLGTVVALLATIVTKQDVFGLRYVLVHRRPLGDRLPRVSSMVAKLSSATSRVTSFLPSSWRMKTLSRSHQQASLDRQLAAVRAEAEAGQLCTDLGTHDLDSCQQLPDTRPPELSAAGNKHAVPQPASASAAPAAGHHGEAKSSSSKASLTSNLRTTAADSHGYWHKQPSVLQSAQDRLRSLQMVGGMGFWELVSRIRAAARQGRGEGAGGGAEVRLSASTSRCGIALQLAGPCWWLWP